MTHQEIEQNDIIDAYLLDRLSDQDRQAFEEHFFACDACFAQVQEHDRFVRGVQEAAESGALPTLAEGPAFGLSGWLQPVFALSLAAAIILVAVTAWLAFIQIPDLRRQAEERQRLLDQERQRTTQLEQQLASNRPPAAEANLPLVMLDASRAANEANTLSIPAGATHVALWMEIGPAAGAGPFRLELRTKDNRVVETIEGLTPNRYGALAASAPAEHLQTGDFVAKLFATNGSLVSEYRLQVRK